MTASLRFIISVKKTFSQPPPSEGGWAGCASHDRRGEEADAGHVPIVADDVQVHVGLAGSMGSEAELELRAAAIPPGNPLLSCCGLLDGVQDGLRRLRVAA